MARLEAIAVGLYWPTPEPVVAAIARFLHLSPSSASPSPTGGHFPVRMLDPCAGKGRALALLADTLQDQAKHDVGLGHTLPTLELYGIEPNADRAQEATVRIPNLLVTSYFTTTLSEGGFQLAFVNPPYDHESDADGVSPTPGSKHERLELRFLRRTTSKLAADGVLIWIVPQVRLREAAKHLAEHYTAVRCWRFPDELWRSPDAPLDRPAVPMYDAFAQVVVLARRRRVPIPADEAMARCIESWAAMGAALPPLSLSEHERVADNGATSRSPAPGDTATPLFYPVPPATLSLRYFLATSFNPDAVANRLAQPGGGVWGERSYVERHWPDLDTTDLGIGRPLAPLRRGHLALLAAAGIANGQELVGTNGRRLVVKGACRKVTAREETRDADPVSGRMVTTTIETDHFEVALWAIDLDTGELAHIQ